MNKNEKMNKINRKNEQSQPKKVTELHLDYNYKLALEQKKMSSYSLLAFLIQWVTGALSIMFVLAAGTENVGQYREDSLGI